MEKTAKMSHRVDAALPDVVDEVMREAYGKAIRPNGRINLSAVPTHADVTKEVMTGRLRAAGLESNHGMPKYVQKLLGIAEPGVLDTVPPLILPMPTHRGTGQSFHNILYGLIPRETRVGALTEAQILDRLRQAYDKFGWSEVFPVVQEWYHVVQVL